MFELTNDDLFQNLHEVLNYIDEPFADSSALAVNILCFHAKKHVSVALSGDGADEIFAGYNKHYAEYQARKLSTFSGIAGMLHPLTKVLPKSRNSLIGNKFRQVDKFIEGIKLTEKDRYWRWAGFSSDLDSNSLLKDKALEFASRKRAILKEVNSDYNSILKTDMDLVLENDMLVKVDRMSMSRSLEVRVPFLDQKIVDFAFTLPSQFKISNQGQKLILKDTFRSMLPNELYNRKKQGFEVPLLKWFQTDLRNTIENELLDDNFIVDQGIFNPIEVSNLKKRLFSSNPNDSVATIWALVVFQYWWKNIYDNL